MKSAILLGTLCGIASAICDHGTTFFPRDTNKVHVAEFGFDGLQGPLAWHGLKDENKQCAVGKNQSPININSGSIAKVSGKDLTFEIERYPYGAELLNLGSTLEVVANGTLVRSGKKYSLKQFHFHTPSEHRIDGEHYAAEVHFVFQSSEGKSIAKITTKFITFVVYIYISI
jgi:carbonic anhydrase